MPSHLGYILKIICPSTACTSRRLWIKIYFLNPSSCWILDIINMIETIIIEQGNTAIYRVGENEKVASDEDCWCAF